MSASAFAPAKVNLYLHVGPPGPDGFHPLDTLMVFADAGDEVSIASAPAPPLRLTGPFASGLAGEDNLVLRAARRLAARLGRPEPSPALVLDKRLPVAAGLGGGSADAAATLRLLNAEWKAGLSAAELEAIAADLGSDVPACVRSRPVTASGRGDILGPEPRLPDLPAVLVNPGAACPTGDVYGAYDRLARFGGTGPVPDPGPLPDAAAVALWLEGLRNDLEPAAMSVAPVVAEVLDGLRSAPEARLARLSGSGATCFALCEDAEAARRLESRMRQAHPAWWVRACRLGGLSGQGA